MPKHLHIASYSLARVYQSTGVVNDIKNIKIVISLLKIQQSSMI